VSAPCNECRTLLGGYVLHALEPDEADAVRQHIATCAACATEYELMTGIPAVLDAAGPAAVETLAEDPPPALEEAVLDRFAREHRGSGAELAPAPRRRAPLGERLRSRFVRPLPAALAGALAAAAITAAVLALPGGSDSDGGHYRATLAGLAAAPGARASADLQVQASGTDVRLKVSGLRGRPATVYELWCLRDDGGKVSAGTFRTDASGRAEVNLTTAAVPGEYHKLSVERKAFAPTDQPGQRVMAGEIQYPPS
jgi:hypothetical protein